MNFIEVIYPRVKAAGRRIILPEGADARVVLAAIEISRQGVAVPVVLATAEELAAAETQASESLAKHGIEVIDYKKSGKAEELAAGLYERRKHKGMTEEMALERMHNHPLCFGSMMLQLGYVDGLVAGSLASTPEVLRSAFQCIGTAKGISLASACFVMDLETRTQSGDKTLLFADSAVNPNPTAEQLVDIAQATATSYRSLMGKQPRLAFLSFSTKGSAPHPMSEKMKRATALTQDRFAQLGIDAVVDGELQADAALVPMVGGSKNPAGKVQGDANILIFPDLQSGNIAYKLVERLAGASAYGPILQGVAKPVNDLSRGCSVQDIVGVAAITVCQGLDDTAE